jgi:hypothetical protein
MTDIRFDIKKTGRVKILWTTRRVGRNWLYANYNPKHIFRQLRLVLSFSKRLNFPFSMRE